MKKKLRFPSGILMILFSNLLTAQDSQYKLQFKSGDVYLNENISEYNSQGTYSFNNTNYLILQFYKLPSFEQREQMKNKGIVLLDYIPNLSYVASIASFVDKAALSNAGVRSFYEMNLNQKMETNLFHDIFPDWAKEANNEVKVDVVLMNNFSLEELSIELKSIQANVLVELNDYKTLTLKLPASQLKALAAKPWIMWVEPVAEPVKLEGYDDKNTHRSNVINNSVRNITGKGVKVGVWDAGRATRHIDFSHRLTQVQGSADHYHACHVSGILLGRGLRNPKGIGMAPDAWLYSYDYGGTVTSEVQAAINNYGIIISSNSYGGSAVCTGDPYTSTSRAQDLLINTNSQLIFVFSSGNSQTDCSGGFNTLTGKATKNTFTVGAVSDKDGSTGYSSYGPTKDLRVKPELVSVGSNVISTYLDNQYAANTGTSMACPGVAGVAAQLVQAYRQANANADPKTSLTKALMCNTAKDLGNAGPDYKFGYGRINALRAVRAIEDNRYKIDNVTTGATKDITIAVPAGTSVLKVMLAWNDPAATANANPALINDLNLEVIDPTSTSWNPWILNGTVPNNVAVRGIDSINNLEQVTITNPPAGNYIIRVKGIAVPSGANQEYAITWVADPAFIEVTFPSGGEMLSPGSAAILQWDNQGLTATQKIEYSLDAGATWTNINASAAATATNYTWAVPNSAFTSKALIRITSGTVTDVSDYHFTIMGVPTALAAADDPCGIEITWAAVTNATGYDVMLLDTVNGVWNVVGSNVSATTYAVGGLTAGIRYWFTVRSRNAAQTIIGERAVAISRINTNTGITAPTITANGSVLSTQAATTYQWLLNGNVVAGATSQNYTITQGGNYSVIVSNSSGCNAASPPLNISLVGVNDYDNSVSYSIYPNPNNGIFTIEINSEIENNTLVITNAIGEEVKKMQFDSSSIYVTIDMSEYGAGIYFATLVNEKTTQTKKIIVY